MTVRALSPWLSAALAAAAMACAAERDDGAAADADTPAGARVDSTPRDSANATPDTTAPPRAAEARRPAARDTSRAQPPRRERTPQPTPPAPRTESLRGIVRVVGSEPLTQVVLRDASGGERRLTGDATAALRRVSGTEVSLSGSAGERGALVVREFTVRAVDGEPVIDGTVAIDGDDVVIVTATGRILLGNPPSELRGMPGARVWVGGPPATGPNVYGVIER